MKMLNDTPPESVFSRKHVLDNTTEKAGRGETQEQTERESATKLPLASVFSISRCIYCESKNIVKKGKRKKKHEVVQLYLCKDCNKVFTGQTLKGKTYPPRMVLDGVSYYNVGFSYSESARFLERSYGLKVDSDTLARWVNELEDLCRYSRMREYGLKMYSPHQIIESSKMFHRQVYHFRYQRGHYQLQQHDGVPRTDTGDLYRGAEQRHG